MSSYSFSNQFYQHWTGAPDAVRAAIVQELTDITTLLQTDTVFEAYTFSTHDLDAHLDDLYVAHQKQQAQEKEFADKQIKLRAAAEQQRTEDEKAAAELKLKPVNDKNTDNNEARADVKNQSLTKTLKNKSNDLDVSHSLNGIQATVTNDTNKQLVKHNNLANKADKSNLLNPIKLSLKGAKLNADPEQLIQELEVQIDDYLTEQMLLMSENLKSWLRAEVRVQLGNETDVDKK